MQPICFSCIYVMYSSNFDKLHVQPLEMRNHRAIRHPLSSKDRFYLAVCKVRTKNHVFWGSSCLDMEGQHIWDVITLFIFSYTHIYIYYIHRFEKMSWMQTTPAFCLIGDRWCMVWRSWHKRCEMLKFSGMNEWSRNTLALMFWYCIRHHIST